MIQWRGRLLAMACASLVACATTVPLQRGQINAIAKDSSAADVERALTGATAVAQFEVAANDKTYFARHYLLQTGSRQEMTMVCTPACIPIFYNVPVTVEYVVIQRMPSKAMHAWGTLEELSKDADPEVSSIMPAVKREYEKAKKK